MIAPAPSGPTDCSQGKKAPGQPDLPTKYQFGEENAVRNLLGHAGGFLGACTLAALWTTAALAQPAHFNSLGSFAKTNGAYPWSTLLLASDGNFYGTTENGGKYASCANGSGCGTVFKMTARGKLKTLFNFNGPDGAQSYAALVQGPNGNLYGVTSSGGKKTNYFPDGAGTIFEISTTGKFTNLYKFSGPDGAAPLGALVLASDGNFYGTTGTGGDAYLGTIFKITPTGTLTKLWDFDYGNYGVGPNSALIQSKAGDFYGAATGGGFNGSGIVFRYSARGKYSVVHDFSFTDGGAPYGALVQGTDGDFYGVTENGGDYVAYGTVFKLTANGHLTTLHSFNMTDGDVPVGTLVQAADGDFYGSTAYGGTGNFGTIFRIKPDGKLTTLYSFDSAAGAYPYAGMIQAPDGKLYGDTFAGGPSTNCPFGCGALFSLSIGHK